MISLNTEPLLDALREHFAVHHMSLGDLLSSMKRYATETDRTGHVPAAFWQEVNVRSLNLNLVPPEYGGELALWPLMRRVLLMEQMGYADPALALALPGPGLSTPPLVALASEEQKQRFFRRFESDVPTWGGFAITEPDFGSDATAMRTTAKETADGYVLNGTKCFITNGARADFVITFATVDRGRGRFGVRAFAVDRGSPGFEVVRLEKMLGLRGSQLAVLSYADCKVPKENMLRRGNESRLHDAFAGAQSSWDYFRPILSSVIVGNCQRIRDELAEHLEAGGRPADPRFIGRQVDEVLVDMDRKIRAARLLCHKAAWKHERGLPVSKDSSMAKAFASRVAMEIAQSAIQLLGLEGLGQCQVLERCYRDAKAYDILEGTGDMQRLMITRLHQRQPVDFSEAMSCSS